MKKNSKTVKTVVSIIAGVIAFFIAYMGVTEITNKEANTKKYSSNGFNITLPDNFYEKDLASVTTYLESEKVIVTALKEEFSILGTAGISEDSSLDDYAEAVAKNNNLTIDLKEINNTDYKYFTYERTNSGKTFYYMGVVLKSNDSFWLVNFACEKKNKDEYHDKFVNWAKTIKVD